MTQSLYSQAEEVTNKISAPSLCPFNLPTTKGGTGVPQGCTFLSAV